MVKAIIFDCFGVLTTDGWLPFKQKYFGANKALFDEASDLNQQAGAGLIGLPEFYRHIAALAELSADEARQQITSSAPNYELFDYIRTALKPIYKLGLLSNAGADRLDTLFAAEDIALFDATALSFEVGAVKPDEQAYQAICKRLGVEPIATVFVDDLERHCAGAREVGMQAIVYHDFGQLKAELETILSDSKH